MDDLETTGTEDEGDSLSDTIAAAMGESQSEDIIAELAGLETPATQGETLSDDGAGAETPGDGSADRTEEPGARSTEPQKEVDTGPERDTGATDAHRQIAEAYQAAVAPYEQYLAARGIDTTRAVQVLLAAEHQLSTGTPERKAQIFAKLAQDYGIDLYELAESSDAEVVTPEMAQIQQRIGNIERGLAGEQQQAAARVQQDAESQVKVFTEAKDDAGNLLRPHLGKVATAMGRLIGEDSKLTLQEAYKNAVWGNPALRKVSLAKQRAAPVTKSAKAPAKPAKEPNLRDTVAAAYSSTQRAGI